MLTARGGAYEHVASTAAPRDPHPAGLWSIVSTLPDSVGSLEPVPRQNTATMALTCGLTGSFLAGKIASCACPPALSDHAPGVRLADVAGPRSGVEGCKDHGVAS